MLNIGDLATAIAKRQEEWVGAEKITLEYRGNELAGECGEACNIIKKLARARHGITGTKATSAELFDELADVIICAILVANEFPERDLTMAIISKFNRDSAKHGMKTVL